MYWNGYLTLLGFGGNGRLRFDEIELYPVNTVQKGFRP